MSEETEFQSRLPREVRGAAQSLSRPGARDLVELYYDLQKMRIEANNRALHDDRVAAFFAGQLGTMERQVRSLLGAWVEMHPVGGWLLAQHGIGPVLAAGLVAWLDVWQERPVLGPDGAPRLDENGEVIRERVPIETVGHWWRFAGLDPSQSWGKGERRPHNARLKTLCWKVGESFVKSSGSDRSFYGALYRERKELEVRRNETGGNAAAAKEKLERFPRHAQRDVYASGKLPASQVHARARRWTVKLFLSHLHEVWYRSEFGCAPPDPYALKVLGHAHKITPPEGDG